METTQLLIDIKNDIDDIKKFIRQTSLGPSVSDKWLQRTKVMEFLNYGPTQMAEFEKNGGVVVTKIGKRKFINRDSLAKQLNNNTVKNEVLQNNPG
jgi:hypothetical protein